jgi:hypothetical protein
MRHLFAKKSPKSIESLTFWPFFIVSHFLSLSSGEGRRRSVDSTAIGREQTRGGGNFEWIDQIAGRWKRVVGDKGEAVQKDPRHNACAYGWGEGSGNGLGWIGGVMAEGEPSRCVLAVATMVFTLLRLWLWTEVWATEPQ